MVSRPPRISMQLSWEHEIIYFVTFNVAARRCVLANDPAYAAWRLAIGRLTTWNVLAGVMMPDHIHMLAAPLDRGASVSTFSGLMKRWMRQQARRTDWRWQQGIFDRLLRREESAAAKWVYIRENPVRAGLINHWEDWPYRVGFEVDEARDNHERRGCFDVDA